MSAIVDRKFVLIFFWEFRQIDASLLCRVVGRCVWSFLPDTIYFNKTQQTGKIGNQAERGSQKAQMRVNWASYKQKQNTNAFTYQQSGDMADTNGRAGNHPPPRRICQSLRIPLLSTSFCAYRFSSHHWRRTCHIMQVVVSLLVEPHRKRPLIATALCGVDMVRPCQPITCDHFHWMPHVVQHEPGSHI